MQPQRITIKYDGKQATTIDLAAAEYGFTHDAMNKAIRRAKIEPFPERIGHIPLYPAAEVREVLRDRPGRGAPGRPKPHRAGSAPTDGSK